MSTQQSVKCDFCGVVKASTNHWWKLRHALRQLMILPFDIGNEDDVDACGEACVTTGVQRFLTIGKLKE